MIQKIVCCTTPPVVTPTTVPPQRPTSLPVRSIPGGYGWPVVGPLADRLSYFWFHGPTTHFKKRIEEHKSTVFRTNMPPTFPFFTGVNSNVIAVLDCKSFAHMFDMELVEKKNILIGDFMPSTSFTGDIRVCAYLDTSEPQHTQVKKFAMEILKRSSKIWVPTVTSNLDTMWNTIESDIAKSGSVSPLIQLQKFIFNFLSLCLIGADPSKSPEVAEKGYMWLDAWLALQVLPTVNIGILQPLEEILLHSFAYPSFLVSGGYNKLAEFIEKEGQEVLELAENEFGLSKKEALHNLIFILGFNAFGGFSVFLPSIFNTLGNDKTGLQQKLRNEVKEKIGTNSLSFDSVKQLDLVNSFVYETLRLNPPVPLQYARARKDFTLSSHDSAFEIKKGELLCGFQPQVMRDEKVFDEPEKFVADRFTKEKGSELLNYLFWSNGPQTGSPTESNKQCAAKDYVTLTTSIIVAHMFQRYESLTIDSSGSISAVEKAK
ncbi:Fatty acid hydroperoxide lyase [Heracleum sosnowskyi]|uniref:Fatty acid hydroperoxide lyase n=1 Tax=Heracleum sosnowskyi TaxID=360622 RepID=A0AAD8N4V6_9APIA|nr:Fatty acid hydroperoxide lyase [Heracleum sosnowskyi]